MPFFDLDELRVSVLAVRPSDAFGMLVLLPVRWIVGDFRSGFPDWLSARLSWLAEACNPDSAAPGLPSSNWPSPLASPDIIREK